LPNVYKQSTKKAEKKSGNPMMDHIQALVLSCTVSDLWNFLCAPDPTPIPP